MYPITAKQFRLFCTECDYWIKYYGLSHWSVDYLHEVPFSDTQAIAECRSSLLDKHAALVLNLMYDERLTDNDIREAAWHEVSELFQAPLYLLARERHITDDQLTEARHSIIQMMKHFTYEAKYKKKRGKLK